eukprot:CAMPEP_0117510398 /NCGR_PEP_ID=MMETSP0784-20121206/27969_1 /TAXON_ID=39447 /ORGANISM="" /LENGTH=718 /DNA_ID=CAMNT_0005306033 /DNA_START=24 /DNA_END=2177 /DNA_ORIENTATION=-
MSAIAVRGLAKTCDSAVLIEYFAYYGDVMSADVRAVLHPESGKPVRIGKVFFKDAKSAGMVLKEADVHVIEGRAIDVKASNTESSPAAPKRKQSPNVSAPAIADEGESDWDESEEPAQNRGKAPPRVSGKVKATAGAAPARPHKKARAGPALSKCDKPGRKLFVGGLSKKTTQQSVTDYFAFYGKVKTVSLPTDASTGKSLGWAAVGFVNPALVDKVIAEEEPHVIDGRRVDTRLFTSNPGGAKIFVGGLAKATTQETFRDYFAFYGEMVRAHAKVDADTQKCRGFGFVDFVERSSAEAVLKEKAHSLDGKAIEVRPFQKVPPTDKVFVGGLSSKTTTESLTAYFAYYGDVGKVRVKTRDDGKCAGFAFVRFADPVSCELAVTESEQHVVDGKKIAVRVFEKKPGVKLFIGGLSRKTTSEKLSEYLAYYGAVKDCAVKADPASGQSRGFAFAQFVDPVSTDLAINETAGHMLDGKAITIKASLPPAARAAKVFIGGLAETTTEATLNEYLSYYGELQEVSIKVGRGFGFARFSDPVSAELAVSEAEHQVDGKAVTIRLDDRGATKAVKIFVGGLSPDTTADSLYAYLAYYGELKEVDVKIDAATGLNRGFGFATFSDPASAKLALAEPEHIIDEKVVRVQASERKGKGEGKGAGKGAVAKVFVGGLAPATTAESLYEYLSYYGELSEVDVKVDQATGRGRGFAFATFVDAVSAELALA